MSSRKGKNDPAALNQVKLRGSSKNKNSNTEVSLLNDEMKAMSNEREDLKAKLKSSEEKVSQLLGQQEILREKLDKIEEMIVESLNAD